MFNIRKKCIRFVLVSCLFMSASAEAYLYYSNDPNGSMFLKRSFGDMVNCGPLSALMLTKFADKNTSYDNVNGAIERARISVQGQDKDDLSYRWWSIRDIKKFLNLQGISFFEVDTQHFKGLENHSKSIVDSITAGNVLILGRVRTDCIMQKRLIVQSLDTKKN